MNDFARCTGQNCNQREDCKRYLLHLEGNKGVITYLSARECVYRFYEMKVKVKK